MRVPRGVVAIGVAVVVTVGAVSTWAFAQRDTSSARDEARYISRVSSYMDGRVPSRPLFRESDTSVLVAEGDRACAWLAGQPVPQGRDLSKSSWEMWHRYFREVPAPARWPFPDRHPGSSVRGELVYAAWNYLCDDVQDHHIYRGPPGEGD